MPHISIDSLSLQFPIYGVSSRSLRKRLVSTATGGRLLTGADDVAVVVALDAISLEIERGDRVALVGHNGSGKTSLLRVLAGVYQPTQGSVSLWGDVGAILDPVAGLDPESNGLQNIYLRGRALGLHKNDISEHLDEIIEFTELGEFIDLPLRTYSAGMYARLAFAVSTVLRPDILIIDEGIGTGDARFIEKMRARLEGMIEASPILVLATHDEGLIRSLCTKRVVLEHGRIVDVSTI